MADSLLDISKRRVIRELIGSVRRAYDDGAAAADASGAKGKRPSADDAWYVLVVDKRAMRIISASCRMFDVMEEHITVVEDITRSRQPLPKMPALYFLSPTAASVSLFLRDFQGRDRNMYSCAHLYFTSTLPQEELKRIAQSPASPFIKTLKEFNLDYLAIEPRVFHLDTPTSFYNLYSPESKELRVEIETIASRLVSLCLTLNEYPYIRYERNDKITSAAQVAETVQRALDSLLNKGSYTPSQENRSTLLIVGRTIDTMAPILMEFTYQAMAYSLLPIDGDRYQYRTVNNSNVEETREVILGTHDPLWQTLRHMHIADTTEWVVKNFNGFLSSSKATQLAAKKKEVTTLREMGDAIKAMPQYIELLSKYSLHMSIASECMSAFNKRQLVRVSAVEQDMATGYDADGKEVKNVMASIAPLLADPAVSGEDKKRLLMLYIISQEGIKDQDRSRLFEYAALTPADRMCISNLSYLGVTLSSAQKKKSKGQKDKKKRRSDDVPFELSRYVPRLKTVMFEAITDQLSQPDFPFVRDPPAPAGAASRLLAGDARSGLKRQSAMATWADQKGKAADEAVAASGAANKPKLLVFVLGGMTYSEMRSTYEISKQESRQCFIGSTHLLTPSLFLNQLGELKSL